MHGEQGALRLHGEDRAAGAEHGREVLRRHAGDRRGAPRRGLLAAAARQVRARLSDQPAPAAAPRRHAVRVALGLHLSRHAGPDRGRGAGVLRADPRSVEEPARGLGERLRDAGRGAPRRVRSPRAARLLPAAHAEGARRARGVRRRGLLPAARPLPGRGGVGDARPAGRGVLPLRRRSRSSCRSSAPISSPASCRR